jgi:hypothetical protein
MTLLVHCYDISLGPKLLQCLAVLLLSSRTRIMIWSSLEGWGVRVSEQQNIRGVGRSGFVSGVVGCKVRLTSV